MIAGVALVGHRGICRDVDISLVPVTEAEDLYIFSMALEQTSLNLTREHRRFK